MEEKGLHHDTPLGVLSPSSFLSLFLASTHILWQLNKQTKNPPKPRRSKLVQSVCRPQKWAQACHSPFTTTPGPVLFILYTLPCLGTGVLQRRLTADTGCRALKSLRQVPKGRRGPGLHVLGHLLVSPGLRGWPVPSWAHSIAPGLVLLFSGSGYFSPL